MAKLTKSSVFKEQPTRPETPLEKTTRIVKTMVDDEAKQRHVKNTRLRNARLERDAHTPAVSEPVDRKTGSSKVTTKR